MRSNYLILKVKPGADFEEVKRAYRKAVQRYHPDSNGGVGNPEMFKLVVKAYKEIQEHHRSMAIKPAPKVGIRVLEVVDGWVGRLVDMDFGKKSGPRPVATAERRKIYETANIDPLLANLHFDELILRLTESQNDMVKMLAARALAATYGVDAVPILEMELDVASDGLKEEIIFSLGLIDHRHSAMVIERFIKDKNVKIAAAAVNALRNMNRSYAEMLLRRLEREGRSLKNRFAWLLDGGIDMGLAKQGLLDRSEIYIASVLGSRTRQPIPVVLRELGWILPESA